MGVRECVCVYVGQLSMEAALRWKSDEKKAKSKSLLDTTNENISSEEPGGASFYLSP